MSEILSRVQLKDFRDLPVVLKAVATSLSSEGSDVLNPLLQDERVLHLFVLLVSHASTRAESLRALASMGASVQLDVQGSDTTTESSSSLVRKRLCKILADEAAPGAADALRDDVRNRFYSTCGAIQQACFELGRVEFCIGAPSTGAQNLIKSLDKFSPEEISKIAMAALEYPVPHWAMTKTIRQVLIPKPPCIDVVLLNAQIEFECPSLPLDEAYPSPSLDRIISRLFDSASHSSWKLKKEDQYLNPEWTQPPQFDRGVLRVPRNWSLLAPHALLFAGSKGLFGIFFVDFPRAAQKHLTLSLTCRKK